MKTNIQEKIAFYHFQDSQKIVNATALGNFAVGLVFGWVIQQIL